MRPWVLAELNYGYLREHPVQVAVLPLGATEPHNLHLPYGTDIFEAEVIGSHACEAAFQRGAAVTLLPAIPYGTDTNQLGFPLAINLNPSTLLTVIRDIVDSLAVHGVHKLVLLNSHGGNDFKPVLRELYGQTPVRLFLCEWYRMAADAQKQIFSASTITPEKWKRRSHWPIFPSSSPAIPKRERWRPTTATSGRRGSKPSIAAGSRSRGPGTC